MNGQSFTFTAPGGETNTSAFAGFTSLVPITSLSFSDDSDPNGNGVALDNVSYNPAAVPEASTTVSFGLLLAFGVLVVTVRRKKGGAAV